MISVGVLNDTGCNMLSIHDRDLYNLNFGIGKPVSFYGYWGLPTGVCLAGGSTAWRLPIGLETRLFTNYDQLGNYPVGFLTPWFLEIACILMTDEFVEGLPLPERLSGFQMRRYAYFATEPGCQRLFVTREKGMMFNILPP